MRTTKRRLLKLEQSFAPPATIADTWGSMARARDAVLRQAELVGESRLAEVTKELDELGPLGLWQELVRSLLLVHGFVQRSDESFAATVARALGISIYDLREYIAQGRIGTALFDRFGEPGIATDSEKHSIGSAPAEKWRVQTESSGRSTSDRIH